MWPHLTRKDMVGDVSLRVLQGRLQALVARQAPTAEDMLAVSLHSLDDVPSSSWVVSR